MARKRCVCKNEKCEGKILEVYIHQKDSNVLHTDYCEYHIKKDMQKGLKFIVGIPMKIWGENTLRELALNERNEIYITDIKASI